MNAEREKANQYRVRESVVGGGLQLRPGQIVERDQVGEHAEALVRHGALEPVDEHHEQSGH